LKQTSYCKVTFDESDYSSNFKENQNGIYLVPRNFIAEGQNIGYIPDAPSAPVEYIVVDDGPPILIPPPPSVRHFVMQSGNATHGDTDEVVTSTTVASTKFEDAPGEAVNLTAVPLPNIYERSFQSSVNYLCGRPFLLGTFSWTQTFTMGHSLFQAIFPGVLADIPQIRSVFSYYAYMRPDIDIHIKVNGTPMHYGKLMASVGFVDTTYSPSGISTNAPESIVGLSNRRWVQVSANSVRSAKISVPWLSPMERFPITALDSESLGNEYSFASLDLSVSVPLLLNGDGAPGIAVSVYLVITDPHLSGWDVPTAYTQPYPPPPLSKALSQKSFDLQRKFKTQSLDTVVTPICEAITSARSGVMLSNITSDISTWLSKFRNIPVVGTGFSLGSSVAGTITRVIRALGFSVPPIVATSTPVWYRSTRLLQAEDVATTVPLAPIPYPYVVKDPEFIGTTFGQFSLEEYLQHPTFYSITKIPGTLTTGSIIDAIPIQPDSFYYDVTTIAGYHYIVPTRLTFVSRLFYYWTGPIQIHLAFTASRFQTMRIRVTWWPNPPKDVESIATIAMNDLETLPGIIFDINGDSDLSFIVPYMQPTEWRRMKDYIDSDTDDWRYYANGVVLIHVVNPLVNSASESTSGGIYMQTFISAANGFQFAQPTMETINGNGVFVPVWPLPVSESVLSERKFTTQADDEQNFSSEGLKKKKCEVIGGMSSEHVSEHLHMSTNITSLKQLFSMGGPTNAITFTEIGWHKVSLYLGPSLFYTADIGTLGYLSSRGFMSQLTPAFGFYRGGLRVSFDTEALAPTQPLARVTWNAPTGTPLDYSQLIISALGGPPDMNLMYSSEGMHSLLYTGYSNGNLLSFDIPWYSIYRYLPIKRNGIPCDVPTLELYIFVPTVGVSIVGYISGADDFMVAIDAPLPYLRLDTPT
jgi:hypothetical protein